MEAVRLKTTALAPKEVARRNTPVVTPVLSVAVPSMRMRAAPRKSTPSRRTGRGDVVSKARLSSARKAIRR